MSEVTMLSFGGGQDSTALLYKFAFDEDFRKKYAPKKLVVVMADTRNEHFETRAHVVEVAMFCEQRGIEFQFISPDRGFHSGKWQGLIEFYESNKSIGSKAYPKTCTDNLKIKPIYGFMEKWLDDHYGTGVKRKRGFYTFNTRHGKLRTIIGIAKGEEVRADLTNENGPVWMRKNVEKCYPLLDLGWDRQACQDYIRSVGKEVPPPSNCILCPFMSEIELVWLYRKHPEWFEEWVRLEDQKIAHWEGRIAPEQNLGVWGKRRLREVLESALKRYGDWSLERLTEYKMSHGHCVKSKY